MGQCALGEGAQAQKCTVNLSPGKSCSGSMSISDSYNWCFLHVKTRPYHFGFRCSVKTLLWKLIISRYLFFPKFLFFRFFSWVCSQIWVGKKKVPTNHKNSSTIPLIFLYLYKQRSYENLILFSKLTIHNYYYTNSNVQKLLSYFKEMRV